ncbi:pirin [Humibacillus sp. DSM 29435]|uniref:pirin family protein n=1 Tax=Humibacillus sp. DSM 29435 TaxID=1869167 RepID=UPI00087252E0|nr:pirin family protein [Humibacillus sp. DSM 29435]OFE16214.1 pirin [Humibacillus sp. DSM 29435]
MSNLERRPDEVVSPATTPATPLEVLPYREVPLGGPRAMTVRRTLPQRERSLIGAWCFVDHYGPDDVSDSGGMQVPGHPHTGLQTVSWLFSGEVEHRDTTGVHALVRPGELNIMTAGSGIAHSEFSTAATTVLHGAQLWVALPDAERSIAPAFEHYVPPVTEIDGARALVFLGSLLGQSSPVAMHSGIVGAEINLEPGQSLRVPVDVSFEHGILVDSGTLTVGTVERGDTVEAKRGELAYVPTGHEEIRLEAGRHESARLLLLGGEPFGEQIVMWWNFIGRDHDEVVAFREQWQHERGEQPPTLPGRFGTFPTEWDHTLPAPELPNLRLRARPTRRER